LLTEAVEPSEPLEREVDPSLRVLGHPDVTGDPRSSVSDPAHRIVQHRLTPAGDHHLRAARGELRRRRPTEPRAATGDQDGPSGEATWRSLAGRRLE